MTHKQQDYRQIRNQEVRFSIHYEEKNTNTNMSTTATAYNSSPTTYTSKDKQEVSHNLAFPFVDYKATFQ